MLPSRRTNTVMSENIKRRINRSLIAETGIIPAGMQLLRDTFPFTVLDRKECVVEDANGRETPVMRVMGLIQKGDTENANGRFYSTNGVLVPAIKAIQEDIEKRAVLGEYDHPMDAKIHLDRISHLMTKVWMDGKKMYGEAEVLHRVPCGAALRGLFEHKVRVGISSRGVGDMEVMEQNGRELYRVVEGYAIVTWDVVAEPSVSGAILNIQEGLTRRLRPLKEQKHRFSDKVYQDKLVSEINDYFGIKPKKAIPVSLPSRLKAR